LIYLEKKQTVLVADDTSENIDLLAGILEENYKI
jgi:CheY-like chemotaxis protein